MGQRTNFELTPMAIAALEQILDWSVERIASTLGHRTAQIAARARELGLAPLPDAQRGPHMLGINLPEAAGRERWTPSLTTTATPPSVEDPSG